MPGGPLLDGDPAAFPMLLVLVRSESAKVRQVAISGLLVQDKQTPEIFQALLQVIEDTDDMVRRDARKALQQLDPEAAAKADVK